MQTLQLLSVSLTLVSIPRYRVPSFSSVIIRQILQPSPAKFLNISSNEIELSIFAEAHTLVEFEELARKDRQRQRSNSGSRPSKNRDAQSPFVPIEVSYEQWSVLQLESHSDSLDNSGARVNELSAPLAAAGISILYQSSYMSDFIFVKESRLPEALSLLANAGFDLYSVEEPLSSPTVPISPPLTPGLLCELDCKSFLDFAPSNPAVSPGSVLTRTRSTPTTPSFSPSRSRTPSGPNPSTQTSVDRCGRKAKSFSGEVHLLDSDLTCVGLSDDSVDNWSSKIIKLVAFPDLIPSPPRDRKIEERTPMAFTPRPRRESTQSLSDHSSPPTSDEEDHDEVGYFSSSPTRSTSSLLTSLTSRSSRSSSVSTDSQQCSLSMQVSPSYSKHPSGMGGPLSPLSPLHTNDAYFISCTPTPTTESSRRKAMSLLCGRSSRSRPEVKPPRVPFFSFTRTAEGSSLTTDAELLAMLFPAKDRYMVICGGELDAADQRVAEGKDHREDEPELDDDLDHNTGSNMLKCLQVDLRKFGLDKHGLVNRFSRVLEENEINHMYSSTFRTANLLVDKRYAVRAQTLLRAC
ncbi:hypothetical protein E1B28_004652 [Marasmius oreades]|uniref:CASTOR ACT domain-containing protein n=1 Tax=Marasmius oreades TaxID=181124 RepID=A0A9P8AD69_9AGAR|nr:uncharacterized protein E1B28_004652 [Marasmius oreades]KAG7097287.1 hypothetical protein E1B28_004652 [Marasmius oreades]